MRIFVIVLLFHHSLCDEDTLCDRRPLGTTTEPLPADNRFQLEVKDLRENKYIPKRQYEVRLFSRDMVTPFIAFTISLREDTRANKLNPRKPYLLKAGFLETHSDFKNAKYSAVCNNTIIQSDITPKTEIKVLWTAPEKDNQCVTVFSLVAVQPTVWYSFDGPLSKRVCEDRRKADDMQPMENDNCQVCEDARYQLTIEGMWSQNTHPLMYPKEGLAKFSDIVGASHSKEFDLYTYNSEASDGLKMLAEQGNTTKMELEILDMLTDTIDGTQIRTLIKATAPPRSNMLTTTSFRVTRRHHLVSLVMAILPSPDWFLGVSNMELCDVNTKTWAENVTFNLYPLDAGTDSGLFFESPNEETSPPHAISNAEIEPTVDKEEMKPFARLLFHLVRTYSMANCSEESPATEETGGDTDGDSGGDGDGGSETSEPPVVIDNQPPTTTTSTTTSEPLPTMDPESKEAKCHMTTWSEWEPCDGECINSQVKGYQARYRQHPMDPTPECIEDVNTEDFRPCTEDCVEEEPLPDEEVEE